MTYIRGARQNNMQVVTNSTGYSTQSYISASVTAINGTEVTYTPSSNSLGIIYECNYTIFWNPDAAGSYSCIRLQESTDNGNSWSTIPGTEAMEGSWGETDWDCFILHFIHKLDPWTGSKKLRLASHSYTTGTEFTVGKCLTAASQTIKSLPQVFIYEV